MNNEQKRQYWFQFHHFQQRKENIYTPQFNQVLKAQIKQFTDSGTLMAVDSIEMYKTLLDLYVNTGRLWAHRSQILGRTLKGRQPLGFSQRLIDLMKQYYGIDLLNDAAGITQTTKDQIQSVLSEATQQGWSFSQIVDHLQSPDMTRYRARLIARTETVGAANAAALINTLQIAPDSKKIWISAKDNRVREHHREVDNTIIPITTDFNVGGYPMKAPGDKRAGASEVCGCRCVLAFQSGD